MAITTVPLFNAGMWGDFPASTNNSFNSTNTKFAWLMRAPVTGNIRKIHWRTGGTVTTSQSVTISLQDVSLTTGFPDGTADQSATRATIAASTWYTETMSADRAVTVGDLFCVVIEWTSTTGTAEFATISNPEYNSNYLSVYASGSWGKGIGGGNKGFVGYIEYDDGGIYPILNGVPGTSVYTDFNNAGTYREYGLYFTPPTGLRVVGIGWDGRATGDCDVMLENSSGTALATASLDKDVQYSTTGTNNFVRFSSSVTISAGTYYYAMIKPTSATNCRINWIDTDANAAFGALPFGFGINGILGRKDSGGALTTVNTSKPWVWLICDGDDTGGASATQRSWGYFG